MGSAYAFSPFGFTGMYAGFGDTEIARSNTAIKYRGSFGDFRVAGLAQVGGYNQGNGSSQMWQGQVGGDVHNLYGGTLSVDFVGSYAVDAVNTSLFTTAIPKFYSVDDLKATLSNNTGFLALAKYTWGPAQIFGGWEFFRQANPSNDYPNGFKTIANYNVPGNILDNKAFPTVWITTDAYDNNRLYDTLWTGVKYAVNDRLDVMGAIYYAWQNDYSTKACTGQGIHISSGSCYGTFDAFSLLIDYRPVRRVDLYAGVSLSNVYAGLANGYQATQNIDPTVGVRIKF